jgi:F-type H+-transporting ATPase subunit alpha
MAEIKPAEVTAILRQELAGFSTEAEIKEIGSVLQVGDGIARVYGLTNAQSGELVEFVKTDTKGIVLNLEEDNVGVVLLGEANNIKEGDKVQRTKRIASIMVGSGMLGRVINTLGEPTFRNAPGAQSSWCYFPPASNRTIANRYQSY